MSEGRSIGVLCLVYADGLPRAEKSFYEVGKDEESDTHEAKERNPRIHIEVVDAYPSIRYIVAEPLCRAIGLRDEEYRDRSANSYAQCREGRRKSRWSE